MKAVNLGDNTYSIHNDSMKVYDSLPARPYVVRFSEKRGFYLAEYNDMEINETVYGVHNEKVEKVMRAYQTRDRNLGIILSGDKGIGKSLFAKMLVNEVIKIGMPVIVVDEYIRGIASYIEEIEQEVMILFDEFDKTFGEVESVSGQASAQTGLLSLFDGLSDGKKMFVVTCNELKRLNDCLLNRPGRFHYHFRFSYPTSDEIRKYMSDNLNSKYYGEIDDIVLFSKKKKLNYDCLRAIASEINMGYAFKEAIKDLNIIKDMSSRYKISTVFSGDVLLEKDDVLIDMFSQDRKVSVPMYDGSYENIIDIEFRVKDIKYSEELDRFIVDKESVCISWLNRDVVEDEKDAKIIDDVIIEDAKISDIHFRL